jgi:acetolactate synthase-1/2/3 large subunit
MHVDVPLLADARDFLESLLRSVPADDSTRFEPWLERIAHWKRSYPATMGNDPSRTGRMSHYEFVQALSDAVPADTLIATGSSGLAVEVFYANFRNASGQRVFLTSGLGAMGYGLAAGIGACLANARKPTLVVESDGSLMLNLQELATLKTLALPVTLVVMNNNGYASIRNTQRNYFGGRFIGTGAESGLQIPDLLEVARAFGLEARRVTEPGEIAPAVRESLASGHPVLIDVLLAESEVLMPKVAAIPQSDGSMMSMPLEDMSPLLPVETLEAELGHVSEVSKMARMGVSAR